MSDTEQGCEECGGWASVPIPGACVFCAACGGRPRGERPAPLVIGQATIRIAPDDATRALGVGLSGHGRPEAPPCHCPTCKGGPRVPWHGFDPAVGDTCYRNGSCERPFASCEGGEVAR